MARKRPPGFRQCNLSKGCSKLRYMFEDAVSEDKVKACIWERESTGFGYSDSIVHARAFCQGGFGRVNINADELPCPIYEFPQDRCQSTVTTPHVQTATLLRQSVSKHG